MVKAAGGGDGGGGRVAPGASPHTVVIPAGEPGPRFHRATTAEIWIPDQVRDEGMPSAN